MEELGIPAASMDKVNLWLREGPNMGLQDDTLVCGMQLARFFVHPQGTRSESSLS